MDLSPSTVDTSRPFTSVKEAVAIFGERKTEGLSTPSPARPMKTLQFGGDVNVTIKKLEAELEQTKVELKLLKERGSETEVALATLNAELHKNMSKLARAEAKAAGKAAVRFEISEAENKKDSPPTLSLLGENDHLNLNFGVGGKKKPKHKPIIPLVGDFFFKKNKIISKPSSTTHRNPF